MKLIGRLRLSTQLLALIIVNLGFTSVLKTGIICPALYCYGCPAAAFACPIGTLQNFTAVGAFPYYAIGTLGLFGLTLGRFWCGWACPFGALQDLIARFRKRQDVVNLPPLAWTKYLILAITLLLSWLTLDAVFCKFCPSGSLFAAIPHRIVSSEFEFGTYFYVHLITLAISLVLFYLFGRFWCRYLCPLGAIFGLFNRVSILKVKLDTTQCTNCKICLNSCPVNIEKVDDIGKSSDCIQCGKCISECPTEALQVSASIRS
ncbi:MAG: 4Fe-4S binding protein [Chloroflexota bacterium]|nr:4Fe-4S binding protein [Chloroflexota bacterium]